MKTQWNPPSIIEINSLYDTLNGSNQTRDENPSKGKGNEAPDATKNAVLS